MHKVMIFLKRRQDLSFADFKHWAENQHTKIAAKLPGIRGYRMNVPPAEAAGAPYDAVSEIWFDSAEARAAAMASDAGKAAGDDAAAHCASRTPFPVDEKIAV
jgi:uncharacterized protein (TIGR02118 family)